MDDKKKPPMRLGGRGRPGIDWDTFYKLYLLSPDHETAQQFLDDYDLSFVSKVLINKKIAHWKDKATILPGVDPRHIPDTQIPTNKIIKDKSFASSKKKVMALKDYHYEILPKTLGEKVEEMKKKTREEIVPTQDETWRQILIWRSLQTKEDYATADNLRQHIKLYLNDKIIQQDGRVSGTKLRSIDIAHITRALLDVQKIQRLALGMSTENMGLKDESLSTEVERTADDIPIFAVEINDNGKFVRPRPRQVEQ